MKKVLLSTILFLYCSLMYGQYFNSAAQILNYLAANIASLDPIEGQYDVKYSWNTPYFRGEDTWIYYIVKEPVTNILTFYVYDNSGFHKSRNCKLEKQNFNNTYRMYWRTCSSIVSLENGKFLKTTIELDTQNSRIHSGNPYLVDKIHLHYNMTKVYPTSEDYAAAERRKAETGQSQIWTGTGFALTNNYVVTNYHVIENAKIITLTGINGNFSIKHNASVAATDKNNDLALLKLNGNVSITNIPYSIKTTTSDVGEEIFVLGYPLTATMGDEIKLTTGVISSKSGFQGDISQYQISAPIQPGNSGGPLFDSKGNIIGIVSAKHAGAENVGYAIKSSYLRNLVESVTSSSVLPQTNRVANQNLSGKVKAVKNYIYYITCTR
jgi:S1-C subfamily serine protease